MIKLADIIPQKDLVDVLASPYNFDVYEAHQDVSWVKLAPTFPFKGIAREGGGGVYLAYGQSAIEERPILFVSSEGQSGKVAKNLEEFLSILITIPYWLDLLHFSGNGNLEEMKHSDTSLAKEYSKEHPDLAKAKKLVVNRLGISSLPNSIEMLHTNLSETDCVVVASDGWKYGSLFNSFIYRDNKN